MLLSMVLEYGSVEKMLEEVNNVVDGKYQFHLANDEYVELRVIDNNDNVVIGECEVGECSDIKSIYLTKKWNCSLLDEFIEFWNSDSTLAAHIAKRVNKYYIDSLNVPWWNSNF